MPTSSSPLRERKDPFDELSSSTTNSSLKEEVGSPRGQWTVSPSPKVNSTAKFRGTPLRTKNNTRLLASKILTPTDNLVKKPEETDDEIILSMKNTPKKKIAPVSHVVISPVKPKEVVNEQKKRESVFDRLYKGAFKSNEEKRELKNASQPQSGPTVIAPKSVKPLTIPKEFNFSSRTRRTVDKEPKVLGKRAYGFKATPILKSVNTPFIPKPSTKQPTSFKSPPLQTKTQAIKRARFDAQVLKKQREQELLARQLQVKAQREEERRIKELRKTALVPKARTMPKLPPPPLPTKSAKMLTIPKSPKLSTSLRARRSRDENRILYA